ncbi:hypothetical protein I5907_10495 [Panacibacter sp. DH6]|uniref:3-oxoacyl-ACP synthase n=1 Tax=Panacibacter microcysteis TaxID=2793269 RepID=A0A931EAD1_9BACT|nr:hypothetical protein [Panacibacter microcysteis]MBG9376666.1 hypothetical protein [Panacibacter microcysteis]
MTDLLKITAYSFAGNNTVGKNGNTVFEVSPAMQPEDFLQAAYQHLNIGYPKFYKMDNLCKLGFLATEVLLQGAGKITDPFATAIVLTNANASLDADIRYYDSLANIPSPALFVYTLPNIVIGEISIRHNLKGENAFFIFETFDASFIETYVTNLFSTTAIERCICGWIDFIKDSYEAVLFLVEKDHRSNEAKAFTKDNLNNIYLKHTWKKQH